MLLLPALVLAGGHASLAAARGTQSLDDLKRREAEASAALEGSTAAVQAAGAELARVAAALPGAEQAAAVARGELAGARAKAAAARAEAERAEAARAAAAAEVDAADGEVQRSRGEVSALARMAYQRGRLGDLRDVMAATEPKDALERGEMLRSVFRNGTYSLDRVTAARLVLSGKRAQLVVEEQAAAAARAEADAQEARAVQLAAEADAAVARVQQLLADRQAALATAEGQREADRRAYEQAQRDSRALAEKIRKAEEARRAAAERAAAERRAREAAAAAAAAAAASRPSGGSSGGGGSSASSSKGWLWPGYGRLTSRYGWRTHPIYGDRRFHAGIDLGGGYGAPVLATEDGVVIYAGSASGYGTLVVVAHGDRITSSYAHVSAMLVREGQRVSRGQTIARIGNEGNSTGPHLHFEIRIDGDPVDPLDYVSPP
ncbi:MAG TPA: M23 family metallopeptidase [Mycobacteriales bacterium]|nr:M23 family metallopeptidase [Mycobacteriales bacterium]